MMLFERFMDIISMVGLIMDVVIGPKINIKSEYILFFSLSMPNFE